MGSKSRSCGLFARRIQAWVGADGCSFSVSKTLKKTKVVKISCGQPRFCFPKEGKGLIKDSPSFVIKLSKIKEGDRFILSCVKGKMIESLPLKDGGFKAGRVVSWSMKEYLSVFKQSHGVKKKYNGFYKEYDITSILTSDEGISDKKSLKEELWEELLRSKKSMHEGRAWIDLKIKI